MWAVAAQIPPFIEYRESELQSDPNADYTVFTYPKKIHCFEAT